MTQLAIEVRNLSKRYRLGAATRLDQSLREMIYEHVGRLLRPAVRRADRPTDFWSLRDISFHVEPGEVVGIIGHNGAGKSTLLKILSRITDPTAGEAVFRGRLASLLEVGSGFHPELTGRENIYLSGAVLGMTTAEVRGKFDRIVDFSGIEKFLDTPVKRYSSGMYVRLAFAVAAHLESEILIVDEVLAVGDAEFQSRCLGRMREVASREGRTVLFVSHNLGAITSLCQRALCLERGRLVDEGEAPRVVERYLERESERLATPLATRRDREGTGGGRLLGCRVLGSDTGGPNVGEPWRVHLDYALDGSVDTARLDVNLGIFDRFGRRIAFTSTQQVDASPPSWPQKGEMVYHMDAPCLLWPGSYTLNVALLQRGQPLDFVRGAARFEVSLPQTGTIRSLGGESAAMALPGRLEVTAQAASSPRREAA